MKTRLLAVLIVSSLVLASVAPVALTQDAVAVGGDTATGGDVQYVDCSQVVNAVQGQYGDATAIGDRAVAAIANEQKITVNQVNACLGEIGGNPGNSTPAADDGTPASEAEERDDVLAGTIPEVTELPETGGPSLLAVGASLALIVGGASLMRFRR